MHNPSSLPPNWYVVYTLPQAERKVHAKIEQMGLEAFLPQRYEVRQWSDRKKRIAVPLFANYVFVKTTLQKRFDLLFIRDLVRFVAFEGTPVAVPELEIESIRKVVASGAPISSETYSCQAGETVKILQGPFAGVQGQVVRRNGKDKLLVRIGALQQAIAVEILLEHASLPLAADCPGALPG